MFYTTFQYDIFLTNQKQSSATIFKMFFLIKIKSKKSTQSLSTSDFSLDVKFFEYNIKLVASDSILKLVASDLKNVIFYLKNQSDYFLIKIKQVM